MIALKVLITQSCPTLSDPVDYSLPASSVHGILQARTLEWATIPFCRGSSWPRDQTGSFSLPEDSLASEPPRDTFSSVQFSCSVMSDSLPSHGLQHARPPCLFITNSWSLLILMSIELVIPSNHLILCCSLLLLPSVFPSIRVFSNESVPHIGWPKYWSFSFSISPSNEYSGLVFFMMDWLDLLAVQESLKSFFLQRHSSNSAILWLSAFFIV